MLRSVAEGRIGPYRIAQSIGRGATSTALLARDSRDDASLAASSPWTVIKLVHPSLRETDGAVRFLEAARAGLKAAHPHIVTHLAIGMHAGAPWVAMDYLRGVPLGVILRRIGRRGRTLPVAIGSRIVSDVALGLDRLHACMTGRDPAHLRLDISSETIAVGDDGIATLVPKLCTRHDARRGRGASLAFLSPEQLHRAGVDHRTDIFALGVLLWQMTTGRALFDGSSPIEIVRRVMECKVPRPSTIVADFPRGLEAAVLTATARSRRDRFGAARDFAAALSPFSAPRTEVSSYVVRFFGRHIEAHEAGLARAKMLLEEDP
jgi:serine/threonine-protein kinase